jgi:hypothetical protein
MNVFNRILAILTVLLLAGILVLVLLNPLAAVDGIKAGVSYFEQGLFQDQFFVIFLASGIVLLLILAIILWLEVRRPRRKMVRIKTQGEGNAQLEIQSVAQSLEYRIDELAGVRQVRPQIISRGNDVDVIISLDTSPSVNVPMLTDQIVNLCHEIIENQLGLKIHGKVRINVHHEPYPRGTMPVSGPAKQEPVIRPVVAEKPVTPVAAPKATPLVAAQPAAPASKAATEPAPAQATPAAMPVTVAPAESAKPDPKNAPAPEA